MDVNFNPFTIVSYKSNQLPREGTHTDLKSIYYKYMTYDKTAEQN